jgi:hypothetical protein
MGQSPFGRCYAQAPGAIPLLLEELIMQLDTLCNVPEQINGHPKLAAKIPLGKHRIVNEVVELEHELVVRINSSSWQNTEPPC